MKLEQEFVVRAQVAPPRPVGPGPFGDRQVFSVVGGAVEGDRINGKVLPGGGDWILVDSTGMGTIDVRVDLELDDGAFIYMSYKGKLDIGSAAFQGGIESNEGTEFGDCYFMTQPMLECGDERYAWVNRCVFLAEGRLRPDLTVEYQVHRVEH